MENGGNKTIGIFLHAIHYGGIEKFVQTHREVYNPQYNSCHIVVNRRGNADREAYFESLGFKLHYVPMKSPKDISAAARAGYDKLFSEARFDIVHCNLPTNILPLRYAKQYGVPRCVLHSHSNYLLAFENKPAPVRALYKIMMERNADNADVRLACSEEAAQVFGRNSQQAVIVNNAVDFSEFEYDPSLRIQTRCRLGISESQLVFCHVGRMENDIKNHIFLLDVFRAHLDKGGDAKLILVGDGQKRSDFEERVRNLNLEASVNFVGASNQVSEYLNASDLFLFPSKSEGLGISLVEAQASGLPCVASDKVPVRAKYTDRVIFAPIDKGVSPWLSAIEELSLKGKKELTEQEILQSGYSTAESSTILREAFGLTEA